MEVKKRRSVMRISIFVLITAALVYTLYLSIDKKEVDAVSIGDDAPNFLLKDMNGNEHKLSDYKGKGVFLNFWATYCGPCKEEMPYMNNVFREYQSKGVEILAINTGEAELLVNKFIDTYDLNFPVLYDRDEAVTVAYDFIPLPTTFLIDADGKIVDIIAGSLTEEDIRNYMDKIIPAS